MAASLGAFEQLVLFAVLRLHARAFGVAIRESIEERTGRAVSIGSIYTTLGRLEDRDIVVSRVEKPQGRMGRMGRPRKYYELTPHGARVLRDAYASIQSMAGGVLPELERLADS